MTLNDYVKLGTTQKFEIWLFPSDPETYYPTCIADFDTIAAAQGCIENITLAGTLEIIRVTTIRERVC